MQSNRPQARQHMGPESEDSLIDRVVHINRVAKVVKGGRRFSFSALVVVGDGQGKVGVGLGKAHEVPEAIRKGTEQAKKHLIEIPLQGTTIPHPVTGHYGAGRVMLKPASDGTGVIAGGPVRAVVESAGVTNILTKCLGTSNPHNVVRATLNALQNLRSAPQHAGRRGVEIEGAAPEHGAAKPAVEVTRVKPVAKTEQSED